jgi:RNA polymerase-associated protein CTR9
MASGAATLYIPLRDTDEEIEIPAGELPEDAGEIADILTEEKAPPEVWTKIAVAYHRQGKTEQFERVLKLTSATLSAESSTEAIVKRIEVLNSLAGFQLNQSKDVKADSRDAKADREEHIAQAIRYINEAATLAAENNDVDETNSAAGTWVVRGELQILQNKEDQAKSSYDNAAQILQGYIPALLAKARMAFNEGEYKVALKHYCDTLRAKPDCPAEVRLGIAVCYYRLKRPELAKKAFMRVLQMGPDDQPNVDALMGLAILELNDPDNDANEAIKVALTYAKTAYELGQVGQTNSKVLNYLADHFFFKKNFKHSEELAISGFHHSASEAIKAESCYFIARAYHVSKNYERAMQFYQEAVKLSEAGNYTKDGVGKDYVLPHFGLGQMHMWKKQYSEAIERFEVVVKSHPEDYDTVKVLGWLYAKQGQTASGEWSEYTKRGIKFLRRAVEKRGDDIEVRLELAQLLETDSQRENTEEAKEHYRAAMKVLKRRGIEVRPEILNNLAVLYHRLGKLESGASGRSKMFGRALKALTQGLSADEPGVTNAFPTFFEQDGADEPTAAEAEGGGLEPTVAISPNQLTAAFNLGLVYESLSRWGKAKLIYRSIVKLMPGYVDAWLRLAVLARDGGQVELAKRYFMDAEKNSPKSTNGKPATPKAVDSIILRGAMSLKLEKLGDAQEVFERVVKTLDPQDVYSHVALGNIYFTVAADAAKFKRGGEDTTTKEHKYQVTRLPAANAPVASRLRAISSNSTVMCVAGIRDDELSPRLRPLQEAQHPCC